MPRWIAIGVGALALLAVVAIARCGGNGGTATTTAPPATTTLPPPTSTTTAAPETSLAPTTILPSTTATTSPPTTLALPEPPVGCLLIDDSRDALIELGPDAAETIIGPVVDAATGEPPEGAFPEFSQLEAMAAHPETGVLYATVWGTLGILDRETAAFEVVADTRLFDVDGLAFDADGTLYGISRLPDVADRLVTINLRTGRARDLGPIAGPGVLLDVDDLAFDPDGGVLYGVSNNEGDVERTTVLVTIDPRTGAAEQVGTDLGVADVEGLAFGPDGGLWGTTGERGGSALFAIDPVDGTATGAAVLGGGFGDYEAIACPAP